MSAAASEVVATPRPADGGVQAPEGAWKNVRTLFFCVGAQKAATTWLYEALSAHPDCHVPAVKETHYWDNRGPVTDPARRVARKRDRLRAARRALLAAPANPIRAKGSLQHLRLARAEFDAVSDPSVESYKARLARGRRRAGVMGELTPTYATLGQETFREMAALHDDTRFVFVMRDPVDRLVSGVRHALRDAPAGEADLDAALSVVLADPAGGHMRRSDYRTTVEDLDAAVPADRVLYLFYETLWSEGALEALGRFLGLDGLRWNADRRVNEARGGPARPDPEILASARAALDPVYRYVATRFPGRVPQDWRRAPAVQEGRT